MIVLSENYYFNLKQPGIFFHDITIERYDLIKFFLFKNLLSFNNIDLYILSLQEVSPVAKDIAFFLDTIGHSSFEKFFSALNKLANNTSCYYYILLMFKSKEVIEAAINFFSTSLEWIVETIEKNNMIKDIFEVIRKNKKYSQLLYDVIDNKVEDAFIKINQHNSISTAKSMLAKLFLRTIAKRLHEISVNKKLQLQFNVKICSKCNNSYIYKRIQKKSIFFKLKEGPFAFLISLGKTQVYLDKETIFRYYKQFGLEIAIKIDKDIESVAKKFLIFYCRNFMNNDSSEKFNF